MKKLMSMVIAAAFAVLGSAAFAASHGGAMKDGDKMMADCKDKAKMDKMDDKMKGECKKMMDMKKDDMMKKDHMDKKDDMMKKDEMKK